MRIVISVSAILFGLLHIVAACTQFKSKNPAARGLAVAMACGGIELICAAVQHLMTGNLRLSDTLLAAGGCVLICAAAYANGKRTGNVHLSHHVVRGAVAVLIVAGFMIW